MKFKSSYFKNYYSFGPTDYDLMFMHFYIDIDTSDPKEIELIDKDLLSLKEYTGKCFKLYFNDIDKFNKFKTITHIFDNIKDNIYLRIRNNNELNKLATNEINIIIEKNILPNIQTHNINNIILQIDTISQLYQNELNTLLKQYNITHILVGQICYIGWDYNQEILNIINKFNIPKDDYLNIEKNILISNDIYTIQEYNSILNKSMEIIKDININDSDIDKFKIVYQKLITDIYYDDNGVINNKIENQTLLGGLLNNKCVCEGYCKILQQVLSLVNIESIVVGGNGSKEKGGHLWNQVNINGIWYNTDATYDSYLIHNNQEIQKCLVSDKEVLKTNYPIAKKCNTSYDWEQNKIL